MNTKKFISTFSVSMGLALMLVMSPVLALAQTTSTTKAQATATARLTKIITSSDTAITARITALNNLNTRIQALKNVSSAEKSNISNEVQTNIKGLTSLKAKIDADTDLATATADAKTIIGSYRIYALVIPQGYITASADRIGVIVGMMQTVSAKLQARITADQTVGKNVTSLQTALTDLNAKISDAQIQAGTDSNAIASLVPDQWNKTKLASNTATLKTARADIKVATTDLQAARKDIQTIIQGLKTLGVKASSSATTTAQ